MPKEKHRETSMLRSHEINMLQHIANIGFKFVNLYPLTITLAMANCKMKTLRKKIKHDCNTYFKVL